MTYGYPIELINPMSDSAWPLCFYSYLHLRSNTFRDTCQIRTEALRFWLW